MSTPLIPEIQPAKKPRKPLTIEQRIDAVYRRIRQCCYQTTHKSYKSYGGRGIHICDEWLQDKQAFIDWALQNGYQQGLDIDRLNNDGPYSPTNCRWTTHQQNMRNRRMSIFVEHQGERVQLNDLMERFFSQVDKRLYSAIKSRIMLLNWPIEKALTTPIIYKNYKYRNAAA